MIRGTLCAILVILSLLPVIPLASETSHTSGLQAHSLSTVSGHDPQGNLIAFNATRAQFDLYTKQNASSVGGAPPTWTGNTFNSSKTGLPVPNTSFNVTIPGRTQATENVTFANMPVPKGNVSSITYLRFDLRGNQSNQTKVSYFVYNATGHAAVYSFSTKGNITGGPPNVQTGSPPVGCGPIDNCFDVSKYIGSNLTLTFKFDANSTSWKGLNINVNNVAIASADYLQISSNSHSMKLDPAMPSQVDHNASLTFGYFANVTYPKPGSTSTNLSHNWTQMIVSYFYPNSYTQVSIAQNGTSLFGSTPPPPYPIAQGNCPSFYFCTQSQFVSLNMTMPKGIRTALIIVLAKTVNLGTSVVTTLGGVPTTTWGPGDLLQVKVALRQGVNSTGTDYVSANTTGVVRVTQTFANLKEGTLLLNFTSPLPQDSTLFGQWSVNSTFANGYDFGYTSTSFTLQQLGVTGFSYSGSNQRLNAQGILAYSTNPPSVNVKGYVFAIDSGAGVAPLTTQTISSGTGVYVSNVSIVNGVFTSGQTLVVQFTLVNSAYATGTKMNASLTIDHEYVKGQTHGSEVNMTIPSGFDTFTIQPDYVFEMDATFTPAGIQIAVRGITQGGTPVSAILPPGNPPVTSLRQHAGLFKIAVRSQSISGSGPCASSCANFMESPAYAYVLVNPPNPGRLLAAGSFTSATNGAYSATILSGRILGASKLVFLTLGTDSTGFSITLQGQSTQESTLLQSTLDNIPSATQNQPMSLVLHLKSNSTTVNMNITIALNIQDGAGATKTLQTVSGIIIAPGGKQDVQFSFNAPASVGAYTLTFLSPDYGAPLITGTLQVSVLQSSLQVLVPTIIGVGAAIVILLFFLFRKKAEPTIEPTSKDKPSGGKPKPGLGGPISKSLT